MNVDEWDEIREWVEERFTPSWSPDKVVAYYDDLSQHLAEDVWDALYRLYDRGLDFPPNGSQMRKEVTEVVRARMERARWENQGLPAPTNEGMGWETWRDGLGYSGLSLAEAFEAAHKRIYSKGCHFAGCKPCGNLDYRATVT